MKLTYVVALIAFSFCAASPAIAREQAPEFKSSGNRSSEKPDVLSALITWKTAIETGALDDIMKLYDKDALMISSFAQKPLTKRSQIEDYFKKVIANSGIKIEITDSHPLAFGNIAVNSGSYNLSYEQEGETISTPARFTFVYQLQGGRWVIVEQHSSRVPQPDEDK